MIVQVAMPLAHDIADNARPKTDEFIENVMRPAVQDLIATLEKQADEMSKKVHISPSHESSWIAPMHPSKEQSSSCKYVYTMCFKYVYTMCFGSLAP